MAANEEAGLDREATTQQVGDLELPPHSEPGADLVVAHAPGLGAPDSVALRPGGLIAVGRAVDPPGIALPDPRLSRLHFRVVWDGRVRGYRIGDAGSRNGLFVNGQREVSCLLSPGDVVRAGDAVFVFRQASVGPDFEDIAARVAASELGVILLGESGVGKDRLARQIHEWSGRTGPFVAVNCAAIPASLAAAELFGHTRSAFSGATQARAGLFVSAQGGTLLLDEIGDMPLELQPFILRALEEEVIRPVGADADVPVNVRIVAATHQDLEARCERETFRLDLYARLAQVVLRVPPLRARRHQILPILRASSSRTITVTADAAEALLLWSWPRNVRELRSLVKAFETTVSADAALDLGYLASVEPPIAAPVVARRTPRATPSLGRAVAVPRATAPDGPRKRPGRDELKALLLANQGSVSAVARSLGTTRAQVYRWMKLFGLGNPARSAPG